MKEQPNYLLLALFASLTLGLAPFYPEPHIVGKIRWVIGGANGMSAMDWLDLCWHGAPWVILIVLLIRKMMKPKVL
ncbi:MAG: hypothetical protein IPI50_09525 [Saprospiraceae bacterium]|nr:hypothetical protein [Saprospiraceae bacterium]